MKLKLNFGLVLILFSVLFITGCKDKINSSDWSQFKKDNYRSGATEADIDLSNFGLKWRYDPGQEPIPAWYGPAKEDAYARSGPLPSMRDYDLSYYPIIVANSLYYGSSADDGVHCLDVSDREEQWVFTTGGPIRIAPTYHDGKIYVGSDDGYAYCLNARNGKLVWKYSPTENKKERLFNNGRFISHHPIRTGVMIENGIAYFGASLLPWQKSYICATNAKSGNIGDEGTYVKEYDNNSMTLEGSMASNGTFLIQPQGRIAPVFLKKESGESAGSLSGSGGCFVLITPEKNIIHPQTSRNISMEETSLTSKEEQKEEASPIPHKDGDVIVLEKESSSKLSKIGQFFLSLVSNESTNDSIIPQEQNTEEQEANKKEAKKTQAKFMSYKDGKEIVIKGDSTYVLNDNSLIAYNRKEKKMAWLRRNFQAQRMMLAGDFLFTGGVDRVEAISQKNGQTIWECPIDGTVYALVFANGALYASTSNGYIYKFNVDGEKGKYYPENLTKASLIEEKPESSKREKSLEDLRQSIAYGPFVEPINDDSVRVVLGSDSEMELSLVWKSAGDQIELNSPKVSKDHIFVLPVRKGLIYNYQIKSKEGRTAHYNYDNFFNFFVKEAPAIPEGNEEAIKVVKSYLAKSDKALGLSLVLGNESDQIALALAKQTEMNIVNIESSEKAFKDFAKELQEHQSYGRKISALTVNDLNKIPVLSEIANLVWVNKGEKIDADEVIRLISPNGFAVITHLKNNEEWIKNATLDWQITIERSDKKLLVIKKNPLEDIGVWSHQHGDIRNASYGGESLFGSTTADDFITQWMGRPGARFNTDRSGRKPAPLSINGRMFMQGKERIAALSVYNGQILWMKDIPNFIRMNVLRDCSNWACDEDYLYLAKDGLLLKVNQLTGDIEERISMQLASDTSHHWGYIGVAKNQIIGTTTQKGAQFTNYHGGGNDGWYDLWDGPNAAKVLSNRLFSTDKHGEKLHWEYLPKGDIINSTIVVYDGKIIFVESRSANTESQSTGRGQNEIFKDTRLIALDINTGEKAYEHRIKTIPGKTVYFLAVNSGKSVVVSASDRVYDIITFDVSTGKEVWSAKQKWFEGHHGAHMSKPGISGDRLIIEPAIYNVHTGEREKFNMPKSGHGCAHFAMTDHAVIYRGGSCTMFDFNAKVFSKWERLRPDCWLSTVPAQGMILSPEAGGGCSCGLWYETSMAFAPISRTPIAIIGHTEDSKRDYMNETWGSYASTCNFNQFTDQLEIELKLKPGMQTKIYYTIDGNEPSKESAVYSRYIVLTETAVVRAAIYIKKAGKERRFERSKMFEKIDEKK